MERESDEICRLWEQFNSVKRREKVLWETMTRIENEEETSPVLYPPSQRLLLLLIFQAQLSPSHLFGNISFLSEPLEFG